MKDKKGQDRKARLAEQLRANLQKRKAQARARRGGEADVRDGLAAPDEKRKPARDRSPTDGRPGE